MALERVSPSGFIQETGTVQRVTPSGFVNETQSVGGGGNTIDVPLGTLTLTGFAPTVVVTDHQRIAVPAGSLVLTGNAPTVTVSANRTIEVPAGSLILTGNAPTVVATANQFVAVPAGSLVLTGFAPTIQNGANRTILVPAGSLTLTGNAPTVVVTLNNLVSVPAGGLTLTGYAPVVLGGVSTPDAPQGGGGVGKRRKIWFEVWKNVPLYEAETVEEARKVVKTIKRQAVRKANQARRAGIVPELPKITVSGDAGLVQALRAPVAAVEMDLAHAYKRLWDEMDEEDIEFLLLHD